MSDYLINGLKFSTKSREYLDRDKCVFHVQKIRDRILHLRSEHEHHLVEENSLQDIKNQGLVKNEYLGEL